MKFSINESDAKVNVEIHAEKIFIDKCAKVVFLQQADS